jgi:hypothetical protein
MVLLIRARPAAKFSRERVPPMFRELTRWLSSLTSEAIGEGREILASRAIRTAIRWIWPYAGVIVGMDAAAHYGDATGAELPVQLFISQDHSFGEFLEYSLTTACAVMLWRMWRDTRASAYLANALLMVWLTLDNAMEFHEKFGHWVAPYIPDPAGSPFHANDIGEMLFFLAVGAMWLIGLSRSLFSARPLPAIHSLYIAAGVAMTAFFGVVVDIFNTGPETLVTKNISTWIEDGGEFAFINLTFLIVVAFYDAHRRAIAAGARPAPVDLAMAPA